MFINPYKHINDFQAFTYIDEIFKNPNEPINLYQRRNICIFSLRIFRRSCILIFRRLCILIKRLEIPINQSIGINAGII